MKNFSIYYCEHDDSIFVDKDDETFGCDAEFVHLIDQNLDHATAEKVKIEVEEEFEKTGKIKPRC